MVLLLSKTEWKAISLWVPYLITTIQLLIFDYQTQGPPPVEESSHHLMIKIISFFARWFGGWCTEEVEELRDEDESLLLLFCAVIAKKTRLYLQLPALLPPSPHLSFHPRDKNLILEMNSNPLERRRRRETF